MLYEAHSPQWKEQGYAASHSNYSLHWIRLGRRFPALVYTGLALSAGIETLCGWPE